MQIGSFETHPIADEFPLLEGDEYARFRDGIKDLGQLEPIARQGGVILDGRNRLRAVLELGIEPRFAEYDGDPMRFIVAKNIERRHLELGARALIATRLASRSRGRRAKSGGSAGLTQAQAGELLGVDARRIREAGEVVAKATPQVVDALERGDVSLDAAHAIAVLPKTSQAAALEEALGAGSKRAKAALANSANDNEGEVRPPRGSARALLKVIMRAVTELGATAIPTRDGGLDLAYDGIRYSLTIRATSERAA